MRTAMHDDDIDLRLARDAMDNDLRTALGVGETRLFTRAHALYNAATASRDERMWTHFYGAVRAVLEAAEHRIDPTASARSAIRRLRSFLEENADLEGQSALQA